MGLFIWEPALITQRMLPEIGTRAAAAVVTQLVSEFPAIRFGSIVVLGRSLGLSPWGE